MPNFEREFANSGLTAGIDEAGRGPWAGPVFAAAVILDPQRIAPQILMKIDDSKALSPKNRDIIFSYLTATPGACAYSIGVASVKEIDRLNIRQAALLAMQRAYAALPEAPQTLLIDGRDTIEAPNTQVLPVIGGDRLSYSIAAASIMAKVSRDRQMVALAGSYPEYGWDRNKGYGTKHHRLALETHGITLHHRRSFAPIKRALLSYDNAPIPRN